MSTLLTCPQGHQWELAADGRSKTKEAQATCPICGATVPLAKHARPSNRPIRVVAPAKQRAGTWWIIVAVAAVSLVVVLVVTVFGIILIRQFQVERDSARAEKADADRQRDTADRQKAAADQPRPAAVADLSLLQQSVDNYATRVTEDLQLRDEDWRTLRAELLSPAIQFYQSLAQRPGDEPEARAARARASLRLAQLTKETGDTGKAVELYRQAVTLFEGLSQAEPEVAAHRTGIGKIQNELVALYHAQGKFNLAEESFQRGVAVWRQLIDKYPGEATHQINLADLQTNLAAIYLSTGKAVQALPMVEQTRSTRDRLAQQAPQNADVRHSLAKDYHTLGHLYWQAGNRDNAQTMFEEGNRLLELLARDRPQVAAYQLSLIIGYNNQGTFLNSLGSGAKAEAIFHKGLAVAEPLASNHPAIREYHVQLANLHANLGTAYRATGNRGNAQAEFGEAIKIRKRLTLLHPRWTDFAVTLGGDYCAMGHFLMETNDAKAALPWYKRAETTLAAVRATAPNHAAAREFLRNTHYGKANVFTHLKQHADASKEWRQAVQLADGETRNQLALELGAACSRAGYDLLQNAKHKEALPWYNEATEALEGVLERKPQEARAAELLANSLVGRAITLHFLTRFNQARTDWDRAIELNGDKNPLWHLGRAETLARLDRHEEAAADAEKVAALKQLSPDNLYDLTRVYAWCMKAAKNKELAEKYAARAVEFFRLAIAEGFRDLPRLQKHLELDVLGKREDFQKLVTDLETRIKEGK